MPNAPTSPPPALSRSQHFAFAALRASGVPTAAARAAVLDEDEVASTVFETVHVTADGCEVQSPHASKAAARAFAKEVTAAGGRCFVRGAK